MAQAQSRESVSDLGVAPEAAASSRGRTLRFPSVPPVTAASIARAQWEARQERQEAERLVPGLRILSDGTPLREGNGQ